MMSSLGQLSLGQLSLRHFSIVIGLGGNVQVIQNSLGAILDTIEGIRNAFNFTVSGTLPFGTPSRLDSHGVLPCISGPIQVFCPFCAFDGRLVDPCHNSIKICNALWWPGSVFCDVYESFRQYLSTRQGSCETIWICPRDCQLPKEAEDRDCILSNSYLDYECLPWLAHARGPSKNIFLGKPA